MPINVVVVKNEHALPTRTPIRVAVGTDWLDNGLLMNGIQTSVSRRVWWSVSGWWWVVGWWRGLGVESCALSLEWGVWILRGVVWGAECDRVVLGWWSGWEWGVGCGDCLCEGVAVGGGMALWEEVGVSAVCCMDVLW